MSHLENNLPDQGESLLTETIETAEAEFTRHTGVSLRPITVKCNPVDGAEFDYQEDPHTLRRMSSGRPPRFYVKRKPIIEVTDFRMEFTNGQPVSRFPIENLRIHKKFGLITLLPFANLVASQQTSAFHWALVMGNYPSDAIPQFVCIDYTAGYTDADTNVDLADVREAIAERAAFNIMGKIRSLIPNSVSLDGFSQNFDSAQTRMDSMSNSWEKFLKDFRERETPYAVGVL